MDTFLRYVLLSTISLSLCYAGYLTFLRNDKNFRNVRFFFIASIVLSLLIPLSGYKIDLDLEIKAEQQPISEIQTQQEVNAKSEAVVSNEELLVQSGKTVQWHWFDLIVRVYFLGMFFFLFRMLIHLFTLIKLSNRSYRIKHDGITLLMNQNIKSPFSFFNWIFLPEDLSEDIENSEVLLHERVHASQHHSIDIILIELLSAVMWFNPLVWKMRSSMQMVHEFLADEGVLSTGIDRLRYQALLINQLAEERLISLSSGFNPVFRPASRSRTEGRQGRHSLIKKRMTMMNKSKFNQKSKLKILILIPLTIVLFLGVACVNGQNKSNVVTAIAPVKMNVLYLGVDNPIRIAASGYDASELTVSVTNGRIRGENGNYIINPRRPGTSDVIVKRGDKVIQQSTFRIKRIPDPVTKIAGKKGGAISKDELLKQDNLIVEMENFDFDLSFEIVGFTVSITNNGLLKETRSDSDKITAEQKELFKLLQRGQKLYVEDIQCKGPDGTIRNMPAMAFLIEE